MGCGWMDQDGLDRVAMMVIVVTDAVKLELHLVNNQLLVETELGTVAPSRGDNRNTVIEKVR